MGTSCVAPDIVDLYHLGCEIVRARDVVRADGSGELPRRGVRQYFDEVATRYRHVSVDLQNREKGLVKGIR